MKHSRRKVVDDVIRRNLDRRQLVGRHDVDVLVLGLVIHRQRRLLDIANQHLLAHGQQLVRRVSAYKPVATKNDVFHCG